MTTIDRTTNALVPALPRGRTLRLGASRIGYETRIYFRSGDQVFFTFLLARFPAGLVIYWAWNNTLSVIQQSVIMTRQGVDIPLLENLGIKKKTQAKKQKVSD